MVMSMTATFAYVQVRMQARHGARPNATVWRYLQGTSDFANYLQLARQTPLQQWVTTLDPSQDSDDIEAELRRLFRRHVDEVAAWTPPAWRPAVIWVRRLPDLPALQFLLGDEPVPAWLQHDAELRALGCLPADSRAELLEQSDCTVFLDAYRAGTSFPDAWISHWRTLWPRAARYDRGLEKLCQALYRYLQVMQADSCDSVQTRCETLHVQLVSAFRRYSFQPAALFSYLALTALELARLRGDLLVRQLFATNLEQVG
jgi:hypothetical protein